MCINDIRNQLRDLSELAIYKQAIEKCDPGLVYQVPNITKYQIEIRDQSNISPEIIIHDRLDKFDTSDNFPKIIIILESPHIKEYEDITSIAPAKGPTGKHIEKQLTNLIQKLISVDALQTNQTYNFCIVNPVPYQASLGYVKQDNNLTVSIWKAIWENLGFKDKFLQLINQLPPKTVILNACTKKSGANLYNIKDEVQTIIDSNPNIISYKLAHPSADSYPNKHFTVSINKIGI